MAASSFQVQALLKSVRGGNWSTVVEIYEKYPKSHEVNIIKSGDTALHIAIANGVEHMVVQSLVSVCRREALAIGNERGETPLHLAAKVGSSSMCTYIAVKDPSLIGSRNNNGETSLFVAVSHGRKDAFLCLNDFCKTNQHPYAYYGRKNGDTILHSAISLEFFDIAFYIIRDHPQLVHMVNKAEMSPLHVLASKPSCFPSGTHLTGLCKLLYHCISVSKLPGSVGYMKEKKLTSCSCTHSTGSDDDEVAKCVKKLFKRLFSYADSSNDTIHRLKANRTEYHQRDEEATTEQASRTENDQQDEESAKDQRNQTKFEATEPEPSIFRNPCLGWCRPFCLFCARCCFYLGLCITMLITGVHWLKYLIIEYGTARIRNVKQRCVWSVQVMNELLKLSSENPHEQHGLCLLLETMAPDEYKYLADISPIATAQMGTPLLVAAKNGVLEMVEAILRDYPDAILEVNREKKNIVMLAVENRHLPLYKFLLEDPKIMATIFGEVDKDGNSVLHIAAKLGGDQRPWRMRGAALEMYMEVKWYKFVKHSMPPGFFVRHNSSSHTPGQIFRDTHQKLMDESRDWMTKYSSSASLVSALIATVAFPASATIPGGVQQDSGSPTLEDEPIFVASAISSLLALCFSLISLVVFMVIPTSSFRKQDFRRSLPLKLLVGLMSLFLSTVFMLVSFCTGQYFVLKDKLKHHTIQLYAICCLPVIVFIISQFLSDLEMLLIALKKDPRHQQRK